MTDSTTQHRYDENDANEADSFSAFTPARGAVVDEFEDVLPLPLRPAARSSRFGIAFGLSLGIHALFFLLLGWAMGTSSPMLPSAKPVEFVLIDFSLSGAGASDRDATTSEAVPPVEAAPTGIAPESDATETPSLPRRSAVKPAKPGTFARPETTELTQQVERIRPQFPAPADGTKATADEGIELAVTDWLRRFQHYPRGARRAGIEGTARVRFVIDRSGALRERELIASSGHSILDRAALELLERAAPYPALPSRIAVELIELTLPVEYSIADVRG